MTLVPEGEMDKKSLVDIQMGDQIGYVNTQLTPRGGTDNKEEN